jgi:hypothetical protein
MFKEVFEYLESIKTEIKSPLGKTFYESLEDGGAIKITCRSIGPVVQDFVSFELRKISSEEKDQDLLAQKIALQKRKAELAIEEAALSAISVSEAK